MSNISYYGMKSICFRKLKEFFSEFQYTILSPLITASIFVLILTTINKYYNILGDRENYNSFLIPGIIMLIIIQTSYGTISERIIEMKQIGSFNDYLVSPISRVEIFLSLIISCLIISIFMCLVCIVLYANIIEINKMNIMIVAYNLIIITLIFSSVGLIVGFICDTWESQSSVYNFIVTPIGFLSGTFFSIDSINEKWKIFFELNPFFIIIQNFRNSISGSYNFNLISECFIFVLTITIFLIGLLIFKKGYKIIQ